MNLVKSQKIVNDDDHIFPDNIISDKRFIYFGCTNATDGDRFDNIIYKIDRQNFNIITILTLIGSYDEGPFVGAWVSKDLQFSYFMTTSHLYKISLSDFKLIDTLIFTGSLSSDESCGIYDSLKNRAFIGSNQQTPPVVSISQVTL